MASSKHTGKEMFVDFPSGLTLRFSPSSNPLSTGQPLQEGKTLKLSVRGGSTDALRRRYPLFGHTKDIVDGVKDLLMQAGLWRAPTLRIPVGMSLPSQSLAQMNTQILNTLFPDKQPELQRHSPFRVISGQPPAGGDSMFFDDSTNRSWYLQGKSHYAYCMSLGRVL